MNILLCFNDRFVPIARVLIISLMCHHRDLHFYIGYLNLSEESRASLKELVEGQCPAGNWPWDDGAFHKDSVNRTIEFIEFKPVVNLHTFGRFGLDVWTRCFIWEQIPVDRLLYLDADIVVDGNIEQFYHDDLGNNLIKACPDYVLYGYGPNNYRWARKMTHLQKVNGYPNKYGHYCNSGVILFDVKKMREAGVTSQSLIDFYQSLIMPLVCPDQDFINLYFEGRIKLANPYRYNFETPPLSYMKHRDFSAFENLDFSETPLPSTEAQPAATPQRGATFDPAKIIVYHFSSAYKPVSWRYRDLYAKIYWKYHYLDPQDDSKHWGTRFGQYCWGFFRRHIVPDHPFDFVKRINGGHSPWETPESGKRS